MAISNTVENLAHRLAEDRPDASQMKNFVRDCKPIAIRFSDDGVTPNHGRWPLVVYRKALIFRKAPFKPDAIINALFAKNGWRRSWRDSIYDYLHYHSQVHEVLGVAQGSAKVRFGGVNGRMLNLRAGDVVVLPAGTGHQLFEASRDFLVVGAYPPDGRYDECTDSRDRQKAIKSISKAKKPKSDPVYGKHGGVLREWTSR